MKNLAERSLEITGLFEAEVFVWLMLKAWGGHPLADDKDFANELLENASSALRDASQGVKLIEGVPPTSLNFVAAIWYAETCAVELEQDNPETVTARNAWLSAVRHGLPSCFCDPSDLHQP
jgi:hypothetical protein